MTLIGSLLLTACSLPDLAQDFAPHDADTRREVGAYDLEGVARLFGADPTNADVLEGGAVFLRDATACEVVETVFVRTLGLNGTCSATGGNLSAFMPADAAVAYETAVFVLRQAGFTVTRRGSAVDVSGGGNGSAATAVGGMPSQPEGGGRGSLPASASDVLFIGGVPSGELVFRYTSASFSAIQAFAAAGSLPVIAAQTESGVVLIGSPGDVESLEATVLRRPSVLVVPLAGRSFATLQQVLADVDGLAVHEDENRGELVAVGDASAVETARAITRAIVGNTGSMVADVAFLSVSDEDLRSFGIEPGIAVDAGELALRFGAANEASFSLVVDQVSRVRGSTFDVRPSVSVVPGQTVTFTSGSRVPVVGEIDEENRQSIDFLDVGTALDVFCHVAGAPAAGLYQCDVSLTVSEVVGVGVVDNPVISSREINSTVILGRGDIVFLAAFSEDSANQSRSAQLLFPGRSRNTTSGALSVVLGLR